MPDRTTAITTTKPRTGVYWTHAYGNKSFRLRFITLLEVPQGLSLEIRSRRKGTAAPITIEASSVQGLRDVVRGIQNQLDKYEAVCAAAREEEE